MAQYNEVGKVYERPWGTYTTISAASDHSQEEKDIVVNNGQQLSIQSHKQRQEAWTIVEGNPEILLIERKEDEEIDLGDLDSSWKQYKPGDVVTIEKHWIHSIRNRTDTSVKFHEVQTGFCAEDDIERYQDVYGRVESPRC
jgi:mannose-6-phosphate isomerase